MGGTASSWKSAYPPLVRIAARYDRDGAEDLAQQALTETFAKLGEPESVRELVAFAAGIVRHLSMSRRRNERRRRDDGWRHEAARSAAPPPRTPEDVATGREHAEHALRELERRLGGDPVARGILGRIRLGEDTPAEWARALGQEIDTIRNAKRRLARHVAAVAAVVGPVEPARSWQEEGAEDAAWEAIDS